MDSMTNTLRERYPSIYTDAEGAPTLDYGISCGDGWFALLDTLSALIVQRASARNLNAQTLQVKEKFGGLRFYLRGHDPYISGLVDAADDLSLRHCERCGLPGRACLGGWHRILCRAHFNEANRGAMLREGREPDADGLPDFDTATTAGEVRFHTLKGESPAEAAERREGHERMVAALQARTDPEAGGLRP